MPHVFKRMTGGIIVYLVVSYAVLFLSPDSYVAPLAVTLSAIGSLAIVLASATYYRRSPSRKLAWLILAMTAYFISDLGTLISGYFSLTSVNLNVALDFPYTIHLLMINFFLYQLLDFEHLRSQKLLILDSLTLFTVSMIVGYLTIFQFIPEFTKTPLQQSSWLLYAFLTILLTLFFFLLYASGLKKEVSLTSFIFLTSGTFLLGIMNFLFYSFLFNDFTVYATLLLPLYPLSSYFFISFLLSRQLPVIKKQQDFMLRIEQILRPSFSYILLLLLITYVTFSPVSTRFYFITIATTFLLFLTRQFLSYRENIRLLRETTSLQENLENIVSQKTELLRLREQEFKALFLSYPQMVLEVNQASHILSGNPAAIRKGWMEKPLTDEQTHLFKQVMDTLHANKGVPSLSKTFYVQRDQEELIYTMTSICIADQERVFIILSDITDDVRQEQWLEKLGNHDALTRLPNRRFFEEQLQTLLPAIRYGSLLFVDLDGFKAINDTYGHDAGDLLLQETAYRLQQLTQQDELVARLGGDEFILFLLRDEQETTAFATTLLASLNEPFHINNQIMSVTPSIGISLYPNDGKSSNVLLIRADEAMYHIKNTNKNNFQFAAQLKRN
ncbi:GGDEF domain-containing protein [Exiguobacterium sp. s193]|uniref:GGDEF domain-containing protein n=1 Tax=Exiguobacterium sp. s193 TaxID=2751207 RepID=UPI001BEACAF2|nr:GGDEF domain-containing protein [Exiguobacterium sp. s193]